MKIIGGPFSKVPIKNADGLFEINDKNLYFVGSGRIALYIILVSILQEHTVSSILWLPAYYCDLGWHIASQLGYIVKYYSVIFKDGNYTINLSNASEGDVVLFLNFYGFSQKKIQDEIRKNKKKGCIIIEDITQSLFSNNKSDFADYYFASIRKWTGVFTGGVIYAKGISKYLNQDVNLKLVNHNKSFFEDYQNYLITGEGNRKYYSSCFYEAELMINSNYVKLAMYQPDVELIGKWDIQLVISKRIQNAECLIRNIKNKDILMFKEVKKGDVPFFLPVYLEDRDSVCELLDSQGIYCSILWKRPTGCRVECNLYDNEFGLVCDERYSIDDMKRITDIINEIVK